MKAICWYGTGDIRCENVPDPKIEDPHDKCVNGVEAVIDLLS